MEVSTMFSQAAATQHRIGIGFRILAGGKEVVLPTPVHSFSLSHWARGTTYSRSCATEELEAGNIGIGVKPDFDRRETERTMQVRECQTVWHWLTVAIIVLSVSFVKHMRT